MSIVKEQETRNKIKVKGILTEITTEGFIIEDEKEGNKELLKFSDFYILLIKQ